VQHHHAHIASCMAENHLENKVIGFSLDGTGYGTDGHIWGGEVLLADFAGFDRAFHFDYVPLPGGAAAIHEPWRMALSYLHHHYGVDLWKVDIPFLNTLDRKKADIVLQMIEKKLNSPLTCSCGRLFDAVAALLGIRNTVSYEGQAAIQLENTISGDSDEQAYPLEIANGLLNTKPLFDQLLHDIRSGVPTGTISRRFHNGLVNAFVSIATELRDQRSINTVCLSGGTFQNNYLVETLTQKLESGAFQVFTQSEVPCNDGGLSLGQALIAAHQIS
jgi:hydrogenase maturation protein HypF